MAKQEIRCGNPIIELLHSREYGCVKDFDPEKLIDTKYLTEMLIQLMKQSKKEIDFKYADSIMLKVTENVKEAMCVMMAVSMFRAFRDQGILTDEEYKAFAEDGEERWKNLLFGGNMVTNRVVLTEE